MLSRTLDAPLLCFVTDRHKCGGRGLREVVEAAVRGGADMVQVREKDLDPRELLVLARTLRDITAGRALLFVNDSIEVAVESGADGVQLGEEAISVEAARQVAPGLMVGRSVHGVDRAVEAEPAGAHLLIAGTVFATGSHPGREPQGVDLLRSINERVSLPVLGIGGVTSENVGSVMEAGASGAAVVTAISESDDPERAAREIKAAMAEAWARRPAGAARAEL